jgi:hypothetical protein
MQLIIEDGLTEDQEGYKTQQELLGVFESALFMAVSKNKQYRDAWRKQGWMGNLARIMSKTERLRAMCWRNTAMESRNEPVQDTLLDLINLSAFFLINKGNDNQWGDS